MNLRGREELIKQIKESNFNFNPLEILDIEQSKDVRDGFIRAIQSKQITKRIAATLAFDQISTTEPNRYIEVINMKGYYKLNIQKYGINEAVLISDIEYLSEKIKNNKQQQVQEENLLYICCRSGYYKCLELLLKIGLDIESKLDTNSILLHEASFYGQEDIIWLLMSYGANNNIKNTLGNFPLDEARTDQIKQRIISNSEDKILTIFKELKQEGLAECIQRSEDGNMIRIYRKMKHPNIQKLLSRNLNIVIAFIGPYLKFKTNLDVGLQPAGIKTKYGTVEAQDDYFLVYGRSGENNWRRAIFTSPSPFYAADVVYSQRIESSGQQYCCLVEVLIKHGSYEGFNQQSYLEIIRLFMNQKMLNIELNAVMIPHQFKQVKRRLLLFLLYF
ncbi:unnamed protein product [Paramecium octaurelia]|uniref:Ankyrin repeat protein n=1 Tax=Paramecium octaurelia TaxID=43137 RepID=A0A8S1TVA7_PAROT|nr:unnamed protein product [Paramecium octaurelia]CAD8157791.1 unnamed protein product [Paramecium octaurelia]